MSSSKESSLHKRSRLRLDGSPKMTYYDFGDKAFAILAVSVSAPPSTSGDLRNLPPHCNPRGLLLLILFILHLKPSVSFPHFNHPAGCLSSLSLIWSYLMDLRFRSVSVTRLRVQTKGSYCCGSGLPCKQFQRHRSQGP